MTQAYQKLWLLVLLVVLSIPAARAQSGPYGNEWIVPGQQYYKIKVARDGLYRLDYQYLQRAGISGVNPQRLQLWRRGKEVAIHVGGNTTALDNSTFIEFFGQRNDGALDKGMYLTPADQAQPYYSLFTDTASYFLTWSNVAGKRMQQNNPAATGTPHASRIRKLLQVQSFRYNVINDETNTYQPWAERGEGFFSNTFAGSDLGFPIDSVWRVNTTAQSMRADIQVVGATQGMHSTQVSVALPSGGSRVLGTLNFANFDYARGSYVLLPTDRAANGRVTILVKQLLGTSSNQLRGDVARVAYLRISYAENSNWLQRRTQLLFSNDSTLAGPAYYQLDSIAATVRGYDVTDPYNVQRVEGLAGSAASQRSFVFANANGRTHNLLLADAERALVPTAAKRVVFRTLSPSAHNFIIVSSRVLMKPATSGGVTVANAVRAYADYRASALGGKWDTLVVTSEQLYDQFHYGEKSALGIRQFAQWMLAGSSRPQSLLLLGKGLNTGEFCGRYHRQDPTHFRNECVGPPATPDTAVVRDLVPTSTRGASDIFFTANWQNGDYRPRMITGRISARRPQQVLSYLNKLKEHEALKEAPWSKNVIHMSGSKSASDDQEYVGYLNTYAKYVQSPPFAGKVVKLYRRADYPGTAPGDTPPLNLASDFNAGVGFISYFGHGHPLYLQWNVAKINDATNGFANKGKYPVWYISGCSAGNAFTAYGSFGEEYLLAEEKGIVGFLSDSDLSFPLELHEMHSEMVKLLFSDNTWYGKPVAEVQQEVNRRLQLTAKYESKTAMLMNTIWQGDPALKLFSPLQPDFQTADARLQISPAVVPATAGTRFELKVGVSNPGRITTGPLAIRVTRTFGSTTLTTNFTVPQARQDTTYTLSLTNPATGSVAGANIFQVDLDPDNLIAESDETNNRATLNYSFLTGGVTTLSPPEFAIVGGRAVRLVAQSNVPTITARDYDLEADTVQTFNSPVLQRTKVNAVMVPEWQLTLPASVSQDSVVWYWRVRLSAPQGDESADWATSSFRVLNGRTRGGWSQSHHGQFRRDERTGAEVAVPGGQWTYNAGAQEATITSTRIGPARQWETLYHTIRTSSTGSYTLRLLGIDSLGATTVLNPDVANRALPLNGISAKQYPYLQLQAVLREATPGVTPQLEQWLVTYQGVPEGVVRPSITPLTAAALTQQAQQTGSITVPVTFQNVADFDFTAPLVGYIVLRSGTAGVLPRERYYPLAGTALTAHSQRTYEVKLDVRGLYGTLSGQVVLNPRRQPEQFYFNNELSLPPFQVSNQDTPPVLDVAFDGRHLLNGEIVSPQPIISVQLRDLDKLRPIQNRSNFILSLTPPKSTSSITVDLNAAGIEFVADSAKGTATLTYRPGNTTPLAPGVYTLEVQGKDGTGNLAGSEPYRITFEVIAESTITNVFPYPNPVTSKTKFVFTLTGATLPRNMKIQIVSLTGRVVKEIMMADLGPLRIGNNITEYAWDGTDDYGDRLANGTYLYRVVLDDPDNQFKQRTTKGDRAFKKDWGKLVLLR